MCEPDASVLAQAGAAILVGTWTHGPSFLSVSARGACGACIFAQRVVHEHVCCWYIMLFMFTRGQYTGGVEGDVRTVLHDATPLASVRLSNISKKADSLNHPFTRGFAACSAIQDKTNPAWVFDCCARSAIL